MSLEDHEECRSIHIDTGAGAALSLASTGDTCRLAQERRMTEFC
jgi:hypothetical protein